MEEHGDVAEPLLDGIRRPDDVVLVRQITFECMGNVATAVDGLH